MGEGEPLPLADGPLVRVELPDGQRLYAVVRVRRRERDGSWWYGLQIHLPGQTEQRGRLAAMPESVDFRAPAARCEPVAGQDYGRVPTERHGVPPAWKAENPVYYGADTGPARVVHRGSCRACRDASRPLTDDQARAALRHPDTVPCPICRPDRPLRG